MRVLLLAVALAPMGFYPATDARAGSTTAAETVKFGPCNTGNWRSDDFTGSAFREWADAAESFTFTWETKAGDQIGSIGIAFGSSHLQQPNWEGVRITDIRPDCIMSTRANFAPGSEAWFWWAIYGWTHHKYTYWGSQDAPEGYDNEFYIIFYTEMTREAFLAQPGCVARGSVVADGVIFDCYATPRKRNAQWFAVARTCSKWNPAPAVKLRKIFDYWRSQGLDDNQYVLSLSWAVEGFAGSGGTLQLTDTIIPDLTRR